MYCGAVGGTPRDMQVAVVNLETDCSGWTGQVDCSAPRQLSCLFLDQMRAQSLQPVRWLSFTTRYVFHSWGMA